MSADLLSEVSLDPHTSLSQWQIFVNTSACEEVSGRWCSTVLYIVPSPDDNTRLLRYRFGELTVLETWAKTSSNPIDVKNSGSLPVPVLLDHISSSTSILWVFITNTISISREVGSRWSIWISKPQMIHTRTSCVDHWMQKPIGREPIVTNSHSLVN